MRKRNGYSFLKSVYCLNGLGIVRKNRRILKHGDNIKVFVPSCVNYLKIDFCSLFTIL